jgi:hypothetical protein
MRLMREMGLQKEPPVRGPQTTRSDCVYSRFQNLVQGVKIVHPDHVWVDDIIDVGIRNRHFQYLL